ncbi:MAG: hypothetical protein RL205_395, partial [Actinomycetota bacterium]
SVGPLSGEAAYGHLSLGALEEAEHLDGQGFGIVGERGATGCREAVDQAGSSASRRRGRSEGRSFGGHDEIDVGQGRERTSDACAGHAQASGKIRDGGRTLDLEGPGNALRCLTGEFHNTIVAIFPASPQLGARVPAYTRRVSALEVTDLRVAYGALEAVRGISFTAEPGRITALVGPNGAGKTSTLEACTGVRPFTSGTIRVLGAQPGQSSSRVGTMLQAGGLYPTARPLEWLTYLARLYPDSRDPRELLDLVGIDSSSRTTARRMSGGEQQRLKFAAALLPRPELLFLDEPTAGMDPQARRSLISTIGGLRAEGVAVVLTTHLIADIEELADHVILMRDGLIEAAGTLAELRGEGESMTFDARPGLDLVSLTGALPDGYGATEIGAGRYVIDGEPTPSALACITAWLAERDEATSGIRIGRTSLEDLIIGDES